jgi:hypothetical protein
MSLSSVFLVTSLKNAPSFILFKLLTMPTIWLVVLLLNRLAGIFCPRYFRELTGNLVFNPHFHLPHDCCPWLVYSKDVTDHCVYIKTSRNCS